MCKRFADERVIGSEGRKGKVRKLYISFQAVICKVVDTIVDLVVKAKHPFQILLVRLEVYEARSSLLEHWSCQFHLGSYRIDCRLARLS